MSTRAHLEAHAAHAGALEATLPQLHATTWELAHVQVQGQGCTTATGFIDMWAQMSCYCLLLVIATGVLSY